MKILFDEYPLGSDAYDLRNKTGVYRVADQLARGLATAAWKSTQDLEITYHASQHVWQAWLYYRRHLQGPGTRFATTQPRLVAHRLADQLHRHTLQTADRRLLMRGLRRGMFLGSRLLEQIAPHPCSQDLKSADIYHTPFLPVPVPARAQRRLRCFTTIYDLIAITNPEFFDHGIVHLLRRIVDGLRAEDFVTCISHATRETLLEHAPQLDPSRVFVTHLAAGSWCQPETDPVKISAVAARFGLKSDTPYFLSLGTLEPRKNLDVVIRAFARLRRERQIDGEFRLVLVGGTGWKTNGIVSALSEAKDCREAIILTGFVPDAELPALYSGARAFIYMSFLEGFGLPPLEAMQCGTPVIVSNTSSLPEVVGTAGTLLAPDDLDGLCNAMSSLAYDDGLRRQHAARALQRAGQFGWPRFTEENLAAYRTAMSMQP